MTILAPPAVTTARVGRPAPDFCLPSTRNIETLDVTVSLADYAGRWLVLVFYPLDFTFVCPTELRGYSARYDEFASENEDILGVSADSVHCHRAWIRAAHEDGGLGELRYPLASDGRGKLAETYGVWSEEGGHPLRGTFLIDPGGILRAATILDADVGRSVDETLRTLAAFKTGALCPVDWHPGQPTLVGG